MEIDFVNEIVNTFEFGILIENADREVITINQKFFDLFSIDAKPNIVLKKNSIEVIYLIQNHFNNLSQLYDSIDKIVKGGVKRIMTFTTAQGRVIRLKYVPIFINTNIQRHVWQLEDVTLLKAMKKEVRKQKEYYLKILEKIHAEIVVVNNKHEFQFINVFAVKNKETRDFLIGKKIEDYSQINSKISTEKIKERNHYFKKVIESKSIIEYVEEFLDKNGNAKYIFRALNPLLDESNLVDFVVISGTDITKQIEEQKNKQLLNARFEKIINCISNAVFQIDFNGKIIFVNNAAFDLFPFFEKSPEGIYRFVNTHLISFADRMKCIRPIQLVKQNKNEVSGVLKIGNEVSGVRYLKYSYWYAKTPEDGEIVIGSVADVTSQYVELNAMKFAIDKEQQLNLMKSKFINITSHEIRTPLSVILSSAEIIDMTLPKENTNLIVNPKEYTEVIMQEVYNVTNILNELLMVGAIESGNSKFKGEFVEIQSLVNSVVNRYSPFTDGRNLEVVYSVEPNEQIYIDKKLMKHALENLLNNAFKYSSGKNSPILSVFKKEGNIIFSVQDFGMGIPADEINSLFQSFYRASNVTNISGTGIGLMVVEYAAKMHKGIVEVNSVINEFTVFKLVIPNHHQ